MEPPTTSEARAFLDMMAKEVGEYAGIPLSVQGLTMTVHKSYRFAGVFEDERERATAAENQGAEMLAVVNRWASWRKRGTWAMICRNNTGRLHGFYAPMDNPATMQLMTLGAACVWSVDAEVAALAKLRSLVTRHAFDSYLLTGSFLESSKRSRVTYMFRRLRPTLAIRATEEDTRVLCGLCLHPIGYYDGTWAGAMVPTDEVVAHLLLMRGDEHEFWKQANQHPAWHAAAGL